MAYERPEVEVNTFKKANPCAATIISNTRIAGADEENYVYHVVIDAPGYNFLEGQSVGVLPPGEKEPGKPHAVRLYSIASLGNDRPEAEPLSLCVKRVRYTNEKGGLTEGVASGFIAGLKAGDSLLLTGPAGRKFLLPVESDLDRPYIFIATGTGIAPFRGMIKRLFRGDRTQTAPVHLFLGVRTTADMLYDDELRSVNNPVFHYHLAISREQKNQDGGRMYVHHRMREQEQELTELLADRRTLVFICGLKGMEEGVIPVLKSAAHQAGLSEEEINAFLEHRLEKEVY